MKKEEKKKKKEKKKEKEREKKEKKEPREYNRLLFHNSLSSLLSRLSSFRLPLQKQTFLRCTPPPLFFFFLFFFFVFVLFYFFCLGTNVDAAEQELDALVVAK